MEEEIKHNSRIENKINASRYKRFIDYLKENLGKLDDFIISTKEILAIIDYDKFDYGEFKSEFDKTANFCNLQVLKSKHDPNIYHIIRKGMEIPQKYTKDVISDVVKNGYSTENMQKTIGYWAEIGNRVAEKKKNPNTTVMSNNRLDVIRSRENFTSLNMTPQTLDGTYGHQVYRERESGRFYTVPSYDNYSHDSNA